MFIEERIWDGRWNGAPRNATRPSERLAGAEVVWVIPRRRLSNALLGPEMHFMLQTISVTP